MEELLTFLFFVALWLVARFLTSAPRTDPHGVGQQVPGQRKGAASPVITPETPPPATKHEP